MIHQRKPLCLTRLSGGAEEEEEEEKGLEARMHISSKISIISFVYVPWQSIKWGFFHDEYNWNLTRLLINSINIYNENKTVKLNT